MSDSVHIFRKIIRNGVEIKIKRATYQITYPSFVWEKFPKSLHRAFADSLAYITTWHLPLIEQNQNISYHFSHPPIEPVFFKIILYSLPMNIFENKNLEASSLIQQFYNLNFQTRFKGLNYTLSGKRAKRILKNRAILLLSFGKDSLLTYALLQELGVSIVPIFIKEPQSVFENVHKRKLADRFNKTFDEEVLFFPLSIGRLRQLTGLCWGWDIVLSQYAFILIPYYFYHQSKYLFFGNEQSCNFYTHDEEGYFINPVFEQSVQAMQHLQDIPQQFFINTHIGSLVEPIHEIFITYILHHRYPEIGQFQMSCFSETSEAKKRRWCGNCEKCARMYIFFKALLIPPKRVGFYQNDMLSAKKEKFYLIFNQDKGESAYGGSGLGKDEQLLAFYLAYKSGVKGDLIDKFKKLYLSEVEKKGETLVSEYFGIHSSYSLPSPLRRRILRLFAKEQERFLTSLAKTVGKSRV